MASTNSHEDVFKTVEEFIAFSGGDHAIKRILIANNGIGAIKAIRSIRRWSFETFGNERMIEFVVMATPEDMKANAEYIRMADEVVDVPGGSNNNNYANITLICEIAQRLRVDAVMPMWGHASENPALPTTILSLPHRVTFIGPPAAPMQALGDKIGSTIIAQSAGVPTIAWNGDGLIVDYKKEGIPQSVYDKANVPTAEEALICCDRIGYPVMIKASEGGGGKGIRKVTRSEDVLSSYRQVQGEVPGSPIFVMKMASHARHLEVQLLADKYGEAIALSGRDCSVQRRHQKIIEEGPPIAAPANVFKKMEQAAVSLAKTVGYCNAGTVEYLFIDETHDFAFLELNPRLQVEHPVTENILGLNLPSCQLQVAMGLPLHRIGDIRRLYGRHPRGKDTIDFEFSERACPPRHCIAVRITAENPEAGFQPTSGYIKELQFRSAIDVWGYFSVDNSGMIHEFADSQFGHIFASGSNRENARRAMIVALKELQIRGDIRTTVEYIIKLIQSPDYIRNTIDTMWLDGRIGRYKELSIEDGIKFCPSSTLIATCGAALQAYKHFEQCGIEFMDMLQVGQIGSKDILSSIVTIDLIYENVKYRTTCIQSGPERVIIECNGSKQEIGVRLLADGGYLLNVNGKSHLVYTKAESGGSTRMILDSHTAMFTPEYDPTRLTSSVAGKVARMLVPDGSHVNAGDPYVEIEVMKMYMPLKVAEAGIIRFQISEGAALSPGDLIASIVLDNPDKVIKATLYTGSLVQVAPVDGIDDLDSSKTSASSPHLVMRDAQTQLEKILDGFYMSDTAIDEVYKAYTASFHNLLVPVYEIEECISVLRGRVDGTLFNAIISVNNEYKEGVVKGTTSALFPAGAILSLLNEFCNTLPADKRVVFINQTSLVWNTAEQYLYSSEVRMVSAFLKLLDKYVSVEKLFDNMSFTDVVSQLRKDYSSNLGEVLSLCRSHINLKQKSALIVKIIEHLKVLPIQPTMERPRVPAGVQIRNEINIRNVKVRLSDISKLKRAVYSHISFAANLVLIKQFQVKDEVRRQKLHEIITSALTTGEPVGQGERAIMIKKFADSDVVIRDLLIEMLRQDKDVKIAALEIYLLKTYQTTHHIKNLVSGDYLTENQSDSTPWIKFEFMTKSIEPLANTGGLKNSGRLSYNDLHSLCQKSSSSNDLPSMGEGTAASAAAGGATDDTRARRGSGVGQELKHQVVTGLRSGIIAAIENVDQLATLFPLISSKISVGTAEGRLINALHIVIMNCSRSNDDEIASMLAAYVTTQKEDLSSRGLRRVTFFVNQPAIAGGNSVGIYTYRYKSEYTEDRLFRHIEAPHAFHLDLHRLSNFSVSLQKYVNGAHTSTGNVFLYKAAPKVGKGLVRYFCRLVSFSDQYDTESLFVEALDHLGLVIGQKEAAVGQAAANHMFLSILAPENVLQPDNYIAQLDRICNKYWYKMVRLAVSTVELKISCKLSSDAESMVIRLVASNPTGFVLKIDQYCETNTDSGERIFKTIGDSMGPLDGLSYDSPYPLTEQFEQQRAEAMASSDTLYVYDWPILFKAATENAWEAYASKREKMRVVVPPQVFSCQELVLCDVDTKEPLQKGWSAKYAESKSVILPFNRDRGMNDAGMVAWLLHLCTPECPEGRDVVVISNDITHQAGSFGTKEDIIFFKASEYARKRGIPRLFLAANSGARIGMAQSLKGLFQICWTDPSDPSKGFKYIYITSADYSQLLARFNNDEAALPIICTPVTVSEEIRYVITDIIGEEADLGVENLMGSGLIAGETARAYDEIFTLTLVVGRTVGIGAYLVRLGQRTVQKKTNSPIILTGYQALNKLMGREIYTTNDQLGGPMIMFPNGVSHLLAETHMDSVSRALTWLSFVPASKGSKLPISDITGHDTIDRFVEFCPSKGLTYDPRNLLCGVTFDNDVWQSGFFDKGSFVEALGGWAKTVVVGRGRLGGIPMGVIVTENRTAEAVKPADPADATSREKMVQQAGGVWFPDSAYKTAQALKDFNREGLPCIILANWRGFSGGQRDMFDEVLKFGSMIVDALVAYKQPLFVYIPPFAELRGGAWVVVDSTINADVMEFYAAEDSRGGVLEAAGAASIKFRDQDIMKTAHRTDHMLIDFDTKIAALPKEDTAAIAAIASQIKERERLLFGVYQQIAVHFADLHDTPGRMKSKGVIRQKVQWCDSRTYFYWRLKRRLTEFSIVDKISSANKDVALKPGGRADMINDIKQWFASTGGRNEVWEDDRRLVSWYEDNYRQVTAFIEERQSKIASSAVTEKLSLLLSLASSNSNSNSNSDILKNALSGLSENQKKLLIDALK